MAAQQPVRVDRERAALIVVDMQPDFMEGGALATVGGSEVVEPIGRLMAAGRFQHIAATQDWHPAGHISFASSHEGREPFEVIELYGHDQVLWPDHCVQGSTGAALHERLPWDRAAVIVRKGEDPAVDSYSGFRNNWNADGERPATGLAGYLRDRGVHDVFLCGLARDFCVKWSAEDAAEAGFNTYVLWDLTRPVDTSNDDGVRSDLTDAGVHVTDSVALA
ncbi:bifunctional nicotinamidase/pyrazinamidase [Arhodomonas sp. AD133]|uniref:bifunctional nicotinamidase/pyrazinamidase n=1 Tax=Arhodomonas sp. AD133 TaxID=3415009 RepID=UPI003EBD058D